MTEQITPQLSNSLDQGRNQQIGEIANAIREVFPQATGMTASAGGASGQYLTIIGTDGNPYKIALLSP